MTLGLCKQAAPSLRPPGGSTGAGQPGGQGLGAFFQLIFQTAVAKGSGLAFPPFLPLLPPTAPMGSEWPGYCLLLPLQADAWEPEEEIDGVCRVSLLTTHHGTSSLGPLYTTVTAMAPLLSRLHLLGDACCFRGLASDPKNRDGMQESEWLLHSHIHWSSVQPEPQ